MPKQQSPHWEERSHINYFLTEGFPFNEGFPTDCQEKKYTIILRSGERYIAFVDVSRQYAAEGKQWITSDGETYDKNVVIAWKEL